MSERPPSELPLAKGCAYALAITAAMAAALEVALSLIHGRPVDLSGEWGFPPFAIALVGAPFFLLALAGTRTEFPWLVGLALTAALWGGFLYLANQAFTGVPIFLGPVILLFPLVISFACFAAASRGRPER